MSRLPIRDWDEAVCSRSVSVDQPPDSNLPPFLAPVFLGESPSSTVWFANIPSARNALAGSGMDGKNRRHASTFAVRGFGNLTN